MYLSETVVIRCEVMKELSLWRLWNQIFLVKNSCSRIGERHGNLEVAWDFIYWHIAPVSVILVSVICGTIITDHDALVDTARGRGEGARERERGGERDREGENGEARKRERRRVCEKL